MSHLTNHLGICQSPVQCPEGTEQGPYTRHWVPGQEPSGEMVVVWKKCAFLLCI